MDYYKALLHHLGMYHAEFLLFCGSHSHFNVWPKSAITPLGMIHLTIY